MTSRSGDSSSIQFVEARGPAAVTTQQPQRPSRGDIAAMLVIDRLSGASKASTATFIRDSIYEGRNLFRSFCLPWRRDVLSTPSFGCIRVYCLMLRDLVPLILGQVIDAFKIGWNCMMQMDLFVLGIVGMQMYLSKE